MNGKTGSKKTSVKRTEVEAEDPFDFRTRQAEALAKATFKLTGTGNVFAVGQPCTPTVQDVKACFQVLAKYNYLESYELLPEGMDFAEVLQNPNNDVLLSLIPAVMIIAERNVMSGMIDILSPNNKSLVFVLHVLGWYWHKKLKGPAPIRTPSSWGFPKLKPQNAALVCPMCNHQWNPPSNLITQRAKAYAWLRWLPKHFKEYHLWYPSVKATTAAQKIDSERKGGK